MSLELRTSVTELVVLCERVQALVGSRVLPNLSLPVEAALPDEVKPEVGGAAFDQKGNRLVIDVTSMLARAEDQQEAALLHEIGHALMYARKRDNAVEFGIPGEVIDWLSEEVVADMFACICGRKEAIALVQEKNGPNYRACLEQWRDPMAFRKCMEAYMARRYTSAI